MITEQDLREAIAECQGERHPTANTCIKLASYLTIQRELFGNSEEFVTPGRWEPGLDMYSGSAGNAENTIEYNSSTDFARAVNGKRQRDVMPILGEIMEAVMVFNKPLYDAAIRKLEAL